MKKIMTKEEKEKKSARNKMIIGIVLVLVMILGTFGYAFFFRSGEEERTKKTNYNGIEFVLIGDGLWFFEIQGIEFLTSFNPEDTENISVPIFKTANDYIGKPVFFIGQGQARQEIERNFWNFKLRMQDGCIEGQEGCEEDAPIKTCKDNVIIIKNSEEIRIEEEDNCVFISAPYDEQTRAGDAFLFKILGVKGGIF